MKAALGFTVGFLTGIGAITVMNKAVESLWKSFNDAVGVSSAPRLRVVGDDQ